MIKVKYKSKGDHIKQYHIIHETVPSPKAWSSLILLNMHLRHLDVDYLNSDWKIKVQFNINFLKDKLLEYGKLCCVYCPKGDLYINEDLTKDPPKDYLATVDHVIPVSKGGAQFDYENMVVACWNCNGNKKDHIGIKISETKYTWI